MEEEERVVPITSSQTADDKSSNRAINKENQKNKRKKILIKEAEKADQLGVCYLSRVPPHMDPLKLRQILSQYGEIHRLYLTPEDPSAQARRKKSGGFRGREFSEGWVEFTEKSVAKRVAKMLNGEQIAIKNATRDRKLPLELSAAKRERDFYLSKVDQSKALNKIEERLKKKQKVEMLPKVMRQFSQKKAVVNDTGVNKELSGDILAGVVGGSSCSFLPDCVVS